MDQIQTENVIIIGDVSVDLRQRVVTISDQLVPFTRKEFDMLSFLARHPGWAFTKEQLLDAAWGAAEANYHAVETMIYWIRRKIRPSQNVQIQTLIGYGYKLVVDENRNKQ